MTDQPVFAIARTLAAQPTRVWRAWSERAEFAAWWGPKGFPLTIVTMEFRPGGFFHYSLQTPGGPMWGRFIYRELAAPTHLVWLSSFANEHAGLARAPFNPLWPLEMLTTVTLAAEGAGTALALTAVAHGAPPEEQAVFAAAFPSMTQGFGGTFDQLAAHLAGG